jgi:prefoldin subunit 5
MKNILATGLLVALFIGCGPTAEQLNTIKNLTTEVMNLRNGASDQLGKVDGIVGMITGALAQSDTLMQKFPKDATTIQGAVDQLKSSQTQLLSVKDNVSNWISNFKAPTLENMKFEDALKSLTSSKDEITSASGELTSAISAATAAVDNYKGIAGGFLEKLAAMTKKK